MRSFISTQLYIMYGNRGFFQVSPKNAMCDHADSLQISVQSGYTVEYTFLEKIICLSIELSCVLISFHSYFGHTSDIKWEKLRFQQLEFTACKTSFRIGFFRLTSSIDRNQSKREHMAVLMVFDIRSCTCILVVEIITGTKRSLNK